MHDRQYGEISIINNMSRQYIHGPLDDMPKKKEKMQTLVHTIKFIIIFN